ncbi:hypothetical protein D030_0584C, partial [Vibrio parahaemolyticus AQ3810]
ANFHRLERYSN